jgi:hypothetical protein
MVPSMVTLPWASMMTGVLALLRVNFTVMLDGTVMVVKLKIPLAGSVTVWVQGGVPHAARKTPSAPVLPLLYVWARTGLTPKTDSAATPMRIVLIQLVMSPACRLLSVTSFKRKTRPLATAPVNPLPASVRVTDPLRGAWLGEIPVMTGARASATSALLMRRAGESATLILTAGDRRAPIGRTRTRTEAEALDMRSPCWVAVIWTVVSAGSWVGAV